jgi:hypothetical protein
MTSVRSTTTTDDAGAHDERQVLEQIASLVVEADRALLEARAVALASNRLALHRSLDILCGRLHVVMRRLTVLRGRADKIVARSRPSKNAETVAASARDAPPNEQGP